MSVILIDMLLNITNPFIKYNKTLFGTYFYIACKECRTKKIHKTNCGRIKKRRSVHWHIDK